MNRRGMETLKRIDRDYGTTTQPIITNEDSHEIVRWPVLPYTPTAETFDTHRNMRQMKLKYLCQKEKHTECKWRFDTFADDAEKQFSVPAYNGIFDEDFELMKTLLFKDYKIKNNITNICDTLTAIYNKIRIPIITDESFKQMFILYLLFKDTTYIRETDDGSVLNFCNSILPSSVKDLKLDDMPQGNHTKKIKSAINNINNDELIANYKYLIEKMLQWKKTPDSESYMYTIIELFPSSVHYFLKQYKNELHILVNAIIKGLNKNPTYNKYNIQLSMVNWPPNTESKRQVAKITYSGLAPIYISQLSTLLATKQFQEKVIEEVYEQLDALEQQETFVMLVDTTEDIMIQKLNSMFPRREQTIIRANFIEIKKKRLEKADNDDNNDEAF
jgi:hypothetical protein